MKNKITDILDSLDSYRVHEFSINSPDSSITMDFINVENRVSVEFKDVLSYLFVNDDNIIHTRPIVNKSLNKIAYYEACV